MKPILFSGEMVRAILDGKKTMTRQVMKPQPDSVDDYNTPNTALRGVGSVEWFGHQAPNAYEAIASPYKPGDVLWVREAHALDPPYDGSWDYYGYTDGVLENIAVIPKRFRNPEHVIYRASWNGTDLRWRPSIHMPRWASRITLEVTDVRVERLQDISEADAIAEGIEKCHSDISLVKDSLVNGSMECDRFARLWNEINGKKHPFESNPFVWVISFKVI